MAIIQFESNLYSAFKFNNYDGNLAANFYSQASLVLVDTVYNPSEAIDVFQLRLRKGFEIDLTPSPGQTDTTLTCVGGFLFKGGVAVGNDRIKSEVDYQQYVDPTYVRIDVDALMNQGLPEQTDITIQMEEGFLVEDKYKYPSALGYALPANVNYLTIRTPTRLNPLELNSTSVIAPFNYRLRYFNNDNNQTVYSLFTPNCFAVGNFVGEIASGVFSNMTSIIGAIFPEDIDPINSVSTIDIDNVRARILIQNGEYNFSSTFYNDSDEARIRFGVVNESVTTALTCDAYRIEGILLQVQNFATVSCNATRIEMTYDLDNQFTFYCDPGFSKGMVPTTYSATFNQVTIEQEFEGIILTVPVTSTLSATGGTPFAFYAIGSPSMYLSGTVNALIDWGDGTQTTATTAGTVSHTYSDSNTYTVTIDGVCEEIGNNGSTQFCAQSRGVISLGDINLRYICGMLRDRQGIAPAKLPSTLEEIPYLLYQTNSSYSLPSQTTTYRDFIKSWDTSNITNMQYIFYKNINGMEAIWANWDISSVEKFDYAFYQYGGVTTGFANWGQATAGQTFTHMFENNLTGFGVRSLPQNFITSSATDLSYMFGGYTYGSPASMANWDTSNVTNFSNMFNSSNLVWASNTGNGVSNFDFSSATNVDNFIANYGAFYNINDLSNANFSNFVYPPNQPWTTTTQYGGPNGKLPPWGYDGANAVRGTIPMIRSSANVTISSTQSKVGSKSVYIPVGDSLTASSYNWSTNNPQWTYETWGYIDSSFVSGGIQYILDDGFTDSPVIYYSHSGNQIRMFYKTGNTGDTYPTNSYTYQGSSMTNGWHHFAYTIDKTNNQYKAFIDGSLVHTFTAPSGEDLDTITYLGFDLKGGYYDETRVSNTLRYTSNFTPSTTTHTNDTNTYILLRGETNVLDDPT